MKNKILIITITLIVIIVGGFYLFKQDNNDLSKESNKGYKAVVYKSPDCGCCVGYIHELKKSGFEVETVITRDMAKVKNDYDIPKKMESCHTVIVDDYIIEGHMPISVVEELLQEKPDIDGIALPGMPAGTPGMPGVKIKPYEIYQLKDGNYSHYISL